MSSEADAPPVDMEWLEECNDGERDAMKAMVELFFSRVVGQLKEVEAAIAAGDPGNVRRIAHASAGASGTCGMRAIEKQWRALEKMGIEGDLANAAPTAAQVHVELERTSQFLTEMGLR